jgi:hypothetical protein
MTGARRCTGKACAWLLAAALGAGEVAAAEVYRPRHRLAEELAPVAEALLAPGGRVAVDPHGGALVLVGEPAAVARALATLRSLDVRPAVWRVETTLAQTSDLAAAGVRVSGWVDAGSFRIGRAGSLPGSVGVAVGASDEQRERSFRGEVTVLDGRPAEIWTGSLRVEPGLVDSRAGRPRLRETRTLVPVPTGFRVVPRGRADGSVELSISAAASEPVPGGVAFAATETQVVVRPGETLVLAAVGERGGDASADLLGARADSAASESATLLRVERVDGDPAEDSVSPASSDRSP